MMGLDDMTDVTDVVKVLDDDSSSISSYFPPPPPGPPPPLHRRRYDSYLPSNIKTEPLRVDGKVPDVIHSIEYLSRNNHIIAHRQSVHPFKDIPDFKSLREHDEESGLHGNGDAGQKKEIERPVLEISTKYHSVPLPRPYGSRRPGRHPQDSRPITSNFGMDAYNYSDVSDGEIPDAHYASTRISPSVMIIWSEHLKNALRAVVAYYPFFKLGGQTLHVPSPYRVLYHHREELAKYRNNQPSTHSPEYAAITAKHIDVLLHFLESNNGTEISREEERHRLDTPMATYDYFWLLLKPGEVIYAKRYDIWTPYVISNVVGGLHSTWPEDKYKINAWLLESTGTKVERFLESFEVAPWLGEQAISTLSVVPAAFWREDMEKQGGLSMKDKAIAEGKLYWELLQGPKYMEYDGQLVNSRNGNRTASGPTGFMSGRVICDAAGFDKYYHHAPEMAYPHHSPPPGGRRGVVNQPSKDHLPKSLPRCGCEVCAENRPSEANPSRYVGFEDLDPLTDTPPDSDLFYMLLSNTMPGFILGSRRWGHLNMQHLKPVKTDKEAFKNLVIDEEIKMTVKALIGRFATSAEGKISPWGNDFIKNKGEGRIFLLHGEPGVGKTCTAECIAELTSRPLIALTAGDLSVDSYRVEQNLNYFLELGQRYGALVLLDEADVYLERRRSKDIDRNGLVSVFLRALEYYSGCIVISTNRVRSFDAAFMSRIHVALHYQNLRDEDRERIWANNFFRLDRDSGGRVHVNVAAKEYVWNSRDVRSLQWNGREIRNAMQTALALAESEAHDEGLEKITVAEKHIRAVVNMSRGFKEFIADSMPIAANGYEGDEDEFSDEDLEDDI